MGIIAILPESYLIKHTKQNDGKIILSPQTQYEFSKTLSNENAKSLKKRLTQGGIHKIKYIIHSPISRGGLSVGAVNEQGLEKLVNELGEDSPKLLTFPLQAETYLGKGINKKLDNVWGIKEAIDYLRNVNAKPEEVIFNLIDDVSDTNQTGAVTQKKIVEAGFFSSNIYAAYLFNKPSKREFDSIAGVKEMSLFDTLAWIIYAHELFDVGEEGPNSERAASIAFKGHIINDAINGDPKLRRAINEYLIDPRISDLDKLYVHQLLLAREIVMNDADRRPYEKATGLVLTVYSKENILPMGVTTHELMRLFTKDNKIPVIPHHGVIAISPDGNPYLVGGDNFLGEVREKLDSQGYAYQLPIRTRLLGLKDKYTPDVKREMGIYMRDKGFQLEF